MKLFLTALGSLAIAAVAMAQGLAQCSSLEALVPACAVSIRHYHFT